MIIFFSNISSAIIAGGASLLGSAINGLFNSDSSKKQFERTKELMALQNDMNISNWNRENEYNNPSNQISRLKSAGINADLFYSNGASGLTSGSISPVSSGSSSMANPINSSFGNDISSSLLADSQKKLLDSQTAKNYAEANQTNQITPWVTEEIKSRLALNESNAKLLNENVEKIRNETELLKWQQKISRSESEILSAVKDSRISEELKRLGASEEQSEVIQKNFAKLYTAQINLALAQSYASYVQSDAAYSNATTNRLQYSLDANIKERQQQVNEANSEVDRALKRSNIYNTNLVNQWRRDLSESSDFGRALHDVLSIPVNALGGFFH